MRNLLKQIRNSKDIPSTLLLVAIVGIALWIVALPMSATVQEAYLKRFHLASPSFLSWAIQQPVPAMYNFENQVTISTGNLEEPAENPSTRSAESASQSTSDLSTSGPADENMIADFMINHFPTRSFTFGHTRSHLKENPAGNYHLTTRYRGREIRSLFQLTPVTETEIRIKRSEVSFE